MMLFIKLLLAHLLGDFVLQPTSWVEEKERKRYKSPKLYLHALIHFGLILLVTMDPQYLLPAVVITLSHLLIDAAKLQFQNKKTNGSFLSPTRYCIWQCWQQQHTWPPQPSPPPAFQ